MFYRWRRMEEEDRGRVWRLYGWFTALMACGSCVGAVAWAARMMNLVNIFEANRSGFPAQKASFAARGYSWRAAFLVTYAVEFLCLSAALLMVLDRMSLFAAPQGARLSKLWAAAGRAVMAAVVLGNAAGLAANAAAAVHYQEAAAAARAEAAYYTVDSKAAMDAFLLGQEQVRRGGSIASVQLFSEVAVLLLVVAAFAAVGALCARRVSAGLIIVHPDSAAAAAGQVLRRRVLGTTAFVFVAFLLRAVFSTMQAVASELRDVNEGCAGGLCAPCRNMYAHMSTWLLYTPEFQLVIVLVSSPLALLVALWGMTPKTALQLMQPREQVTAMPPKLMEPNRERLLKEMSLPESPAHPA
jgi:ABC-type multidrug transport system fused ATPase/permease subunit